MTMLADSPTQFKCFVPAARDIRIKVQMNRNQANDVCDLLLAAHPALADLRKVGRIQFINAGGQFRIVPVRGGVLPYELSADDVRCLVRAVKEGGSITDSRYAGLWAERYAIAYGRRGG